MDIISKWNPCHRNTYSAETTAYTPKRFRKQVFWSCKVQVQGPSDSSGINWCEFKLCCGSGNFPQCKLCILGLCFKERKKKGHRMTPADTDLFPAPAFLLTLLLLEPSGLTWIQKDSILSLTHTAWDWWNKQDMHLTCCGMEPWRYQQRYERSKSNRKQSKISNVSACICAQSQCSTDNVQWIMGFKG